MVGAGTCSARSNLVFLERFLNFFQVGQQSNVCSYLVGSCSERCKWLQNIDVNLARVRLTGHRVRKLEARQFGDTLIELLDLHRWSARWIRQTSSAYFRVVAFEQCKKGRLGAGRSFHPSEANVIASALQVSQVPQQLLQPQASSFADRNELGRLKMRPTQARQSAVRVGPRSEAVDDDREFVEQQVQASLQEDEICIAEGPWL